MVLAQREIGKGKIIGGLEVIYDGRRGREIRGVQQFELE